MSVGVAANYPQLKDQGVIATIYSRMVNVKYYAETCMPKITNSKYEGEIKNQGDKVVIAQRPTIVTRAYVKGQQIEPQVPEAPPIEFSVDRARYFAFAIDVVDKHQSHIVLSDEYLEDGNNNMAVDTETEFFAAIYADAHASNKGATAGAKSSSYDLGALGDVLEIDEVTAVRDVTKVKAVLGEQNALQTGGRSWIVIPWWFRYLLMNSDLKNAAIMGDESSVQRTQRLGSLDGVEIYVSNLLSLNASDSTTNIVFGNSDAVAFAAQLTRAEITDRELGFGQLFKGLTVYDWQTLKPEGLGHMRAKPKA